MPEGLVADGRSGLVAVGLREPARLALVNARSGRVVRLVPLPAAPRHLQLQAPGGPVLVPAEDADALVRVALPGGRRTVTWVGDFPHDAVALGERVFVGDEFADTVTVVEGRRALTALRTPARPGGLAVAGDRVAAVAVRQREIELYDGRRLRSLGRLNAGVGPTHLVADRRGLLYVVDTQGDAILMFRSRPRLALICRVNLPGVPYGVAIDPRRARLWVTLTARNELVEFQLKAGEDPRQIATYPTVRQPNTVTVDPASGRVFVAGRTDGKLQLLDPHR
jgi:DNA-binding beta-propeller fold protein YncE